jgi:uncharacterized lipoprotein YddW (UPF0748 family)
VLQRGKHSLKGAVLLALALVAGACTSTGNGQFGQGPPRPPQASTAPAVPPPVTPPVAQVELPRPLKAAWAHLFSDDLKTQAGLDRVLDDAASSGLNAVFVQVVRRHDAYYRSEVLPPTPDPALDPGFDVLAAAVAGGRARGLQVHAWFTVATAWHESYRGLNLPAGHVTREHGPGTADPWMTVSASGTQSREYFDIGLTELQDHVAGVVADIAGRYDVDGVHLDYVRYDGAQWGYHPRALERFRAETGHQGTPAASDPGWTAWKREQSRTIVERARGALAGARPGALLSAAVIAQQAGPSASPGGFSGTRAYADYAQDWAAWVSDGLVDLAVPMVYMREAVAEHAGWFRQWLAFASELDQGPGAVATGIGGWLNPVDASLVQARLALEHTAGVAVFSYQQDTSNARHGTLLRELATL